MDTELLYEPNPAAAHAALRTNARAPSSAQPPSLEVSFARHPHDVREAQRLRWRVFAGEMGASLSPPPGTPAGVDADRFDPHCEHLLVHAVDRVHGTRRVVGTYRLLTPAGALRTGGLYSDDEFDLSALDHLRPQMLELGRSCTDPAYRQGGAMMLMWGALMAFMSHHRLRWMVGCASVPMRDGGHAAASLWHGLSATHLAPPELRVVPRCALPLSHLRGDLRVEPPALIKGYLRCGAKLLGPPAWDAAFGTADLPMMLDIDELSGRYRRHFGDG